MIDDEDTKDDDGEKERRCRERDQDDEGAINQLGSKKKESLNL